MSLLARTQPVSAAIISEAHLPTQGSSVNALELTGLTTGQSYDLVLFDASPTGFFSGWVTFKTSFTAGDDTLLLSDTAWSDWAWPVPVTNPPLTLVSETQAEGTFSLASQRGVLLYAADTGLVANSSISGQQLGDYAPGGNQIETLIDYLVLTEAGPAMDWSVNHLADRGPVVTSSANAVARVELASEAGSLGATSQTSGPMYLSGVPDDNAALPDGLGGSYALNPGLPNLVLTVPEPATLLILAAAAGAAVLRRRSR